MGLQFQSDSLSKNAIQVVITVKQNSLALNQSTVEYSYHRNIRLWFQIKQRYGAVFCLRLQLKKHRIQTWQIWCAKYSLDASLNGDILAGS